MNKLYKKFLQENNIIFEEDFIEVINSLPIEEDSNVSFEDSVDFIDPRADQRDTLADHLINELLNKWKYVYADGVDFIAKNMDIEDVQSLEDLEEIKEFFKGWTIGNYEELLKYLKKITQRKKMMNVTNF